MEDHVSIHIDKKLANLSNTSSEPCIFRINDHLCMENEKAYEPTIVAIGLYHHETIRLDSDEFMEMMLLDDFFIIELFRKSMNKELRDSADHIFQSKQIVHDLRPHSGIPVDNIKHLLGLVHDYWCFAFGGNCRNVKVKQWQFINSATKLQEFGVQFKMVERSDNLFDIKFLEI
ncbi:hypothetical protein ACSBR1_013179 [Camellia fascicularis]